MRVCCCQSSYLEADRPRRASVRGPARAFPFRFREEHLPITPYSVVIQMMVELSIHNAHDPGSEEILEVKILPPRQVILGFRDELNMLAF